MIFTRYKVSKETGNFLGFHKDVPLPYTLLIYTRFQGFPQIWTLAGENGRFIDVHFIPMWITGECRK